MHYVQTRPMSSFFEYDRVVQLLSLGLEESIEVLKPLD